MPKQIVNPCQQVQYEYQYCPISGQGKIDNTNNVYQEMQHLRKVQGATLSSFNRSQLLGGRCLDLLLVFDCSMLLVMYKLAP
jgi:hypothetical protein